MYLHVPIFGESWIRGWTRTVSYFTKLMTLLFFKSCNQGILTLIFGLMLDVVQLALDNQSEVASHRSRLHYFQRELLQSLFDRHLINSWLCDRVEKS